MDEYSTVFARVLRMLRMPVQFSPVLYRMSESEENAMVEEAMMAGANAGRSAKLRQGRPYFVEQRRIYVSKQFRSTEVGVDIDMFTRKVHASGSDRFTYAVILISFCRWA